MGSAVPCIFRHAPAVSNKCVFHRPVHSSIQKYSKYKLHEAKFSCSSRSNTYGWLGVAACLNVNADWQGSVAESWLLKCSYLYCLKLWSPDILCLNSVCSVRETLSVPRSTNARRQSMVFSTPKPSPMYCVVVGVDEHRGSAQALVVKSKL